MTLSALHIFWAIATPEKGKVTKRDLKRASKEGFTSFGPANKYIVRHCGDMDTLLQKCHRISGLKKHYKVTIITDKQFGKVSGKTYDILEVATTMQKEKSFRI